jgi:hypothetical protein
LDDDDAPYLANEVPLPPGWVRAPQRVKRISDMAGVLREINSIYGAARRGMIPAADLVGERLAELERPLSHRFVADEDAAGGEHLLDHPQAEREAEVEPHGVADDLGREAMAGVRGLGRRDHAEPGRTHEVSPLNPGGLTG